MVVNEHARRIPVPADRLGALLDGLSGPDDALWPVPAWPPVVFDRPLGVGADGGHGPIRYRVSAYEPGRRVECTFAAATGVSGTHTLTVEPDGPGAAVLRHVLVAREFRSSAWRLRWALIVRWLHDALLEDLLDRAEESVGTGPARPARWTPWVRLLRWGMSRSSNARAARSSTLGA